MKSTTASVWDSSRMPSDHLKGGDVVSEADHLPLHTPPKKPPVPVRQIKRKTWNQSANDTDTNKTSSPSPSSLRKTRSELTTKSLSVVGDSSSSSSPRLLRKVKSTSSKDGCGSAKVAIIEDADSESSSRRMLDLQVDKLSDESGVGSAKSEKMTIMMEKRICGSDEKLITTSLLSNVNGNELVDTDHNNVEEADECQVEEMEIEKEMKSCDDKEVTVLDKNLNKIISDENSDDYDVKVCQISDNKDAAVVQSTLVVKQPPRTTYTKRSAFYSDFNKSGHVVTKASTNFVKPSPDCSKPRSKFAKPSPGFTAAAASTPQPPDFQKHPASRDRLQSLVDLVMWRDVSRSAFVFGAGTFMIISTSYTQDINISFVSVTSYLGLAYLALIFLFRSIIRRGVSKHEDNDDIIVGEEEAIWILKLVLPYVNEFFLSLRCLFSGDPAMTMKLAIVLFVLARCGSSITIWKMAKLGFVGVFTVPKVVSSYSVQLKTQCKFWIARLCDAWETCTHKKLIAGIIFSLMWNLCSIVARIWALFMVAVAFRYYQQLMTVDGEWEKEEVVVDEGQQMEQSRRVGDTAIDSI